ncbi:MAG: serine hydrolase [Paracoccaceae bacterium]
MLMPLGVMAAPYADFVIDARTGQVLHQDNAETRLHPASLTKMMTLYVAFEAIEHGEISLDTMVTISKHAASMPASKLGLRPGQKIALRYLIRAAAIKSANDAATAIGEAIEGSESAFARRMTRTAQSMGMTKTTFKNANGLTAKGHMSTARDMATLGRRLFYDFPQYYNIFSRRTADAGIAQVSSTNRRFLDSYEGADGIKTGYTVPAGFNLVASAQRGNKRIIAVVFGGKSTASRNARVAELLDLGFGKAPRKAQEQPPAPLDYNAHATEPAEDLLASAIASDVEQNTPAAGKILRLNTAVGKSPRPVARGSAQPGEADDAIAVATADLTAEITADASEMADATDELVFSMQDTIAAALEEAQQDTAAFEQTATPQPETLALVETVETTDIPAAAPADPVVEVQVALATTQRPMARPSALVPAEAIAEAVKADAPVTELAELDVAAVEQSADAAEVSVEMAEAALPETAPLTAELGGSATALLAIPAEPAADAEGASIAAVEAETGDAAAAEPSQLAKAILLTRPEATSANTAGGTQLANAEEELPAREELEIVTRVSTSGGREWGINVGTFSSRYNAEREMLRTALVEMATLDDALRKVVNRNGGFDANFVGMTSADAELACARLSARGTECKVLSPTSN